MVIEYNSIFKYRDVILVRFFMSCQGVITVNKHQIGAQKGGGGGGGGIPNLTFTGVRHLTTIPVAVLATSGIRTSTLLPVRTDSLNKV